MPSTPAPKRSPARSSFHSVYLNSKKFHNWVAWLILLPFGVMLISGVLLQHRERFEWIQPPTVSGSAPGSPPKLGPNEILLMLQKDPQYASLDWLDVQQLIFRPSKGSCTVRLKGNREVQVDAESGKILASGVRNVSFLTDLHEGQWFSAGVKNFVFKPAGLLLLILWASGLVLMLFPKWSSWRKSK